VWLCFLVYWTNPLEILVNQQSTKNGFRSGTLAGEIQCTLRPHPTKALLEKRMSQGVACIFADAGESRTRRIGTG